MFVLMIGFKIFLFDVDPESTLLSAVILRLMSWMLMSPRTICSLVRGHLSVCNPCFGLEFLISFVFDLFSFVVRAFTDLGARLLEFI
jgi:hypothetical protein